MCCCFCVFLQTKDQSMNVQGCQVEETIQPSVTKDPEEKQRRDSELYCATLADKNQQLETQIAELKERYKQEKMILNNIQDFQRIIPSLKQTVTMARINRLEDQLKERDTLRESMENELKAKIRDLEANYQEAALKVWQKDEELKKTTARLMEMTEKYNKQQNLSDAGVLQELKDEQKKRENAEKTLQELETEVKSQEQKLASLLNKVENLHQALKRTENSQQVLMKELENHKQNNQQPGRSLAIEELKTTQLKQDIQMTPIGDLFKEWRDCKLYCATLADKNQQLETQLAELKERYKQEFRRRIKEEQQWREEIEVELFMVQAEAESEAHEDTASVPTEKEEIAEAEVS
ncbi:myosin-9-like isoform X2 [Girardinichthys multiradiatus]|uniref:myosin-9-like isoform X2 n=1 Tax=Girardinichthys multiradiatus TaxID=208333 RepID=UPI001FAE433E|nr:myosin-9-like isoform X2 [Girardinichthys multiradiatus]